MRTATQQRDVVARIARTQTAHALEIARSIDEPWYRCQALAIAAMFEVRLQARNRVIDESFAAACLLGEQNRIVSASAWPLKVLSLSKQWTRVEKETARLLRVISSEASPVRRSDALGLLFGAVVLAKREVAIRVARALADSAFQALESSRRNSKGESRLSACLPGIVRLDPDYGKELLEQLSPSHKELALHVIRNSGGVALEKIIPWPHLISPAV